MPRPIVELMRPEARFYRWLARGGSEPARGSRDRGLPPERREAQRCERPPLHRTRQGRPGDEASL